MGRNTLTEHKLYMITAALHLFSDPTRLNIFLSLDTDGEQHVNSMCERFGLPQPTVSHHLGLLRSANAVRTRREGKRVYYSATKTYKSIIDAARAAL